MGQCGLRTTLIVSCPLPEGMPRAAVEACIDAGIQLNVPVTWLVGVERLLLLADHHGTGPSCRNLALELSPHPSRQELRLLLARASTAFPGLDAAVMHGELPAEYRQVLVAGGIRVLCRDRIDDEARGSRRPAPTGWPCRSTAWGLWEVTRTAATPPGLIGRLLPWATRGTPVPGSLTVVDIGGQGSRTSRQATKPDATSIRARLEEWRSWAKRLPREHVSFATLSDIPALIAGGGRLPVGGSVLKAA